jgi:hypothetical protein
VGIGIVDSRQFTVERSERENGGRWGEGNFALGWLGTQTLRCSA